MKADVLIVGAGVAGCAAARLLAPDHRVVIVDRAAVPTARIGESLPGAARRLLDRLGLAAAFDAGGHLPGLGAAARWGSDRIERRDSLFDPLGPGWRLNRVGFETMLRLGAQAAGATLMAPARLERLSRGTGGWHAVVDGIDIAARFVVFAHGRGAPPTGALPRPRGLDRLVCRHARLPLPLLGSDLAAFTFVEAVADGWWYHATVPGGAVIAFHTDADLPPARQATEPAGFAALLAATRTFAGAALPDEAVIHRASARGQTVASVAGPDWCCVGDAAVAFDPLSAQGMFHALYTGVKAGEATASALAGDAASLADYQASISAIMADYVMGLAGQYASEHRFAELPFWQRRHAAGAIAAAATHLR